MPVEDRELIAEIATRQRLDAVGHHGGLHGDRDFRRFRGLRPSDATLEGLYGRPGDRGLRSVKDPVIDYMIHGGRRPQG